MTLAHFKVPQFGADNGDCIDEKLVEIHIEIGRFPDH